ncbi:hypothetical protein HKX54_02390 [Sulfitobacter sp. M57]|uniref:hypothetical protein n=1 Tax=unclassified Sulfitobacter TaxID=196795 RepID=UPI0023E2CAC1|nr:MULTISPECIES: hypothetical protein [unclassified Sulfitobacter]MDF3413292.1 hypothetical protein [Sulfitobacter sp. KE5]MDF3421428.1 hypothetical protein [Sulfitobacter sp. KE43]MDF3431839.1 hypothetical protein [Sulfitobacter sp. KE42]MDF3457479.1 hypothetical protein [Sulfitobacter sp. S74]MDF3461381.1 hypothetical protein [Sulfitobacter sp. Ks18]
MTKPTKPAAVDGPTLDDAADAQLFSSKTFAWVEFTPLAVQFMADSNDYVDLVAAAVDADAMATEAGRAQAVLKAGEAAAAAVTAGEKAVLAGGARDAAQVFAALAGAAAGLDLSGMAGRGLRVNSAEDGFDFADATLSAASTSGAVQVVDFGAADIHTIDADVPIVTVSFSDPNPVDKMRVIIKNSVAGYDVAGAALLSQSDISAQAPVPYGIRLSPDGTMMTINEYSGQRLRQYALSTPHDVTTKEYTGYGALGQLIGFDYNRAGTSIYTVRYQSGQRYVRRHAVSAPFDSETANPSHASSFSVNSHNNNCHGIRVNDDETKYWLIRYDGSEIHEFTMAVAGDTSTSSKTKTFDLSAIVASGYVHDHCFNEDYSKLFIISDTLNRVIELDLTTPEDILTLEYNGVFYDVSVDGIGQPNGIDFSPGGGDMFLVDQQSDEVYRYSTAVVSIALPVNLNVPNFVPPSMGATVMLDVITVDEGVTYEGAVL